MQHESHPDIGASAGLSAAAGIPMGSSPKHHAETLCGRHVEVSRVPARHALRACETCKRIARAT